VSKFKVGDKVKVNHVKSMSSRDLNGQICTVSEVRADFCHLKEEKKNRNFGVWNEELTFICSSDERIIDNNIQKQLFSDAKDNLASRQNNGKPRPTLFPVSVYRECLKVLEFGAKKYGDFNWQKGFAYLNCADSLERHWLDWKDGQDKDDESKLWHLAHVIVNATFLLFYQITGGYEHLDNRKKLTKEEETTK
jgi:hypothetical protein